jgi:hypothetical protein
MKINIYCYMLIIVVYACATPAPVIRLSPSTVENSDYWNLGQHFVYASDNNILYECGFNRVENNNLIFDVKITNQSDTTILVDPALFMQEVYNNDNKLIVKTNAFDPELVLVGLNINENIEKAKAKNAAAFMIGAAIISAGALVAVSASNKSEEKKEVMYNSIDASRTVTEGTAGAAMVSASARAEDNWTQHKSLSEAFLRKTTLAKGYYIDGEVHFQYNEDATWYRLIFQADKSQVDFNFRQSKIYNIPQLGYPGN